MVVNETGATYRRNRVHIRPTQIKYEPKAKEDFQYVPNDNHGNSIQSNGANQPIISPVNDPASVATPVIESIPIDIRYNVPNPTVTKDRPRRMRDVPNYLKDYDLSGPKK